MHQSLFATMRHAAALALAASFFGSGTEISLAQDTARCFALEQDLAAYDNSARGGGANIRRLEQAYQKQYEAYQRAEDRAQEIGCRKQGFLFFQPSKPAECRGLDARIANMSANLDALAQQREQLLSAGNDPNRQRLLQLLAKNRCGAQYEQQVATAPSSGGGFFDGWFNSEDRPPEQGFNGPYFGAPRGGQQTYRTVCVRQCDGYFFPINFATTPDQFDADAGQCQAMCPTSPVDLYVYENPGSNMENAVSLTGEPYVTHPNAFLYQKEYVRGCSCNQYTLKLHEREAERSTVPAGTKLPEPGPDLAPVPEPAQQQQQSKADAPSDPVATQEQGQGETATIIGLPQENVLSRPEPGQALEPLPSQDVGLPPIIFEEAPETLSNDQIPDGALVAGSNGNVDVETNNGVTIFRPGARIIGQDTAPAPSEAGEPLILDPSRGQ